MSRILLGVAQFMSKSYIIASFNKCETFDGERLKQEICYENVNIRKS